MPACGVLWNRVGARHVLDLAQQEIADPIAAILHNFEKPGVDEIREQAYAAREPGIHTSSAGSYGSPLRAPERLLTR
jgi:hypothetical protein